MTAECRPPPGTRTEAEAKAAWDADRVYLREFEPEWEMPTWSCAPAWRRKPYYLATPPEDAK